ncbi:hypothetical protein [Clostridium vincentii]|uniref:Uncharacterized protein n=1 Tax=Clostridium vincentii TaxID=52704 RepID=A0A2T0B900_9CLOT|nr:hypothetical protein [Clostridium vincentii]PRR80303.1 hypothetical protein CLVI_30930 [Clostridium vincentii]
MGKATTIGVTSFSIFLFIMGAVVQAIILSNSILQKIIVIISSIAIFVWFLKVNLKKCQLFYIDKEVANKISKKDSVYAVIGFLICILMTLNIFELRLEISSFFVIIQILFLYPTIQTNRKMAIRYRKIVKILGNRFELYFNYEDTQY